jgi:hypothetical protein
VWALCRSWRGREKSLLTAGRIDKGGRKRALESTAPNRQQYSIIKQQLRSPLGLRNDLKGTWMTGQCDSGASLEILHMYRQRLRIFSGKLIRA